MTTSDNGYAFLQRNEGFAAHVYNDVGKQAIGYGHDLQPGESFPDGITQDEAGDLLRKDVTTRFEPALNTWLELHGINPSQNQYDALVDFAYNLGTQSLVTMLGHGWAAIPVQIPRWNHVNGAENAALTARRQSEVELWEKP